MKRYPVMELEQIDAAFLQWLIEDQPDEEFSQRLESLPRLSARQMAHEIDLPRLYEMRKKRLGML